MYKTLFLSFLLLSCVALNAQTANLKEYYRLINQAELKIVDSEYSESLQKFDSAFRINKAPFGRHIYNAALVASLQNDSQSVYNYLQRLALLGYDINNLKKIEVYDWFWKTTGGQKLLKKPAQFKPTYIQEYRDAIIEMVYRDRFFRLKPDGREIYKDTIKKIDRENVARLLHLIDKYGYPSEKKVGVDSKDIVSPLGEVIIIHQSMHPEQMFNFSDIVKTALLKGEIENKAGSYLIERSSGIIPYNELGLIQAIFDTTISITKSDGTIEKKDTSLSTGWGYLRFSEEDKEKVNRSRKEIMLEPSEEALRKMAFQLEHPYFYFGGTGSKEIFRWPNYADYLHMKKNMIAVNASK